MVIGTTYYSNFLVEKEEMKNVKILTLRKLLCLVPDYFVLKPCIVHIHNI